MTTFTTGGSAVTFTTSGSAVSFAVTAASNAFSTSPVTTPGAHASTHGAGGADPITTLGAVAHSGQQTFAAGSAAGPSIAATGDTNTGIYFPAADQVGIATAGTAAVVVDASGRLGVGNVGTMSGGAAIQLIGGDNAPAGTMRVRRISASANPSALSIEKARGTLPSSPASVNASDGIGIINFLAHDGTAYLTAATIAATVDGTPGTNDMPTRLTFSTTPDGTATLTERMRIDNAGLITGTGTSLGAWTSYTPTLGGTGWAIGDGTITARYCQLGKIVHYFIRVVFGGTSTYGSGALTFTLPVTSAMPNTSTIGVGQVTDTSLSQIYPLTVRQSTTGIAIPRTVANPDSGVATASPFTWASTDVITFTGTYEAA